jgi:serine protease
MKKWFVRIALLFVFFLGGCGGGGGSSDSASASPSTHLISASASSGGSVIPASQTVEEGDTTTFEVTTETGYSVDQVVGCGGNLNRSTYTTGAITGSCTVEVSFRRNTYVVSAAAGIGGSIDPVSQTVGHGTTVTFTVTPDPDYSIAAVSGCNGSLSGNTYTTSPITTACLVEASFRRNTYVVSATAGMGGSIDPVSRTVDHGTTVTFTVTPDPDYSIAAVSGCNGSLSSNTFTTGPITTACLVEASFLPRGYSISGSISPDALNRIDGDTNDPASPVIDNNSLEEAQWVLAPALIGGFVAAPGTDSRFGIAGDEFDIYGVELQAGQMIVLEVPDSSGVELDLYLLDAGGIVVDAALGPATSLSLAPDIAGAYFVAVRAYAGLSNYSLRLDSTHSLALESRRAVRVSDDFVPGEVIVRTRPDGTGLPEVAAQRMGLLTVAGHPAREQLWRIPEGQSGQVLEALSTWAPPTRISLRWADPSLEARYETLRAIQALGKKPDIETVSPNHIVRPTRLPNDQWQGLQWFHGNIDLPLAWDISTGEPPDAEIVVAVIDTGVFLNHEDLQGKLLPGYDFVRMQPTGDDPGDPSSPGGSSWHGTHVAGIAAAASDNSVGVAGVSWGARILPIRTLTDQGGTLYNTLQGIRYAAGLPNDSGTVPDRRADVINLSLGGGSFSQAEADLYQSIRDQGIFVIAASGNSAGAVSFPAAYDAVFAVGATDATNARAYYSSFGNPLAFVAPGGDMRVDRTGDGFADGILSTVADDTSGVRKSAYAFYQGTSMATPVASGVAALARSVDPGLTPDRFEQLLVSGLLTDDLGPKGWDPETGWGQINALRTLRAVTDTNSDLDPVLTANPGLLDFGLTEDMLEFSLRNAGGGSIQVTQVTANTSDAADWLLVTPKSVGADGLGSYSVMANRDGLADGTFEGSIEVRAESLADLVIPVSLRVAPPDLVVDTVGRIYVLLVDANGQAIAAQGVDLEGGVYSYRFDDVPAAEYRIVATTDMNNDRLICGPAEACGAFPTLSLFESVLVDQDWSALDFSVGFRALAGTAIFGSDLTFAGEGDGLARP